jgi:hypothetical protein
MKQVKKIHSHRNVIQQAKNGGVCFHVPVDESLGDAIVHLVLDRRVGTGERVAVQNQPHRDLAVRVGLARVDALQNEVAVVARQQCGEQKQQGCVHADGAERR